MIVSLGTWRDHKITLTWSDLARLAKGEVLSEGGVEIIVQRERFSEMPAVDGKRAFMREEG